MKEYEIVAKFCNACAGSSRPQTFFEEAELEDTDDFVRMKYSRDFDCFRKEKLPDGRIVYTYDNGSVTYLVRYNQMLKRFRCPQTSEQIGYANQRNAYVFTISLWNQGLFQFCMLRKG